MAGDLVHGIRDLRKSAQLEGWPTKQKHPRRRDRNSWVSFFLRQSCMTKIRKEKRKEVGSAQK